MNQFAVELGDEGLEVGLCLNAGQSFGWKVRDGHYVGVDGERAYAIQQGSDFVAKALNVSSTGCEVEFRRLFRLDEKNTQSRLVRMGPELSPAIACLPGLRMMRSSNPVQTLFSFLCTSNNHIKRIELMVNHLFSLGEPLDWDGTEQFGSLTMFPTLERLAELTEAKLRLAKFGYRASTIPLVAQLILENGGRGYLENLANSPYDQMHEELKTWPGVGPKLADCIALFALDCGEAVPFDVHMWRVYKKVYGLDPDLPLNERRYREAGDAMRDRFGNLAGQAHQFLYCCEMMKLNQ